MNGSTAKKLRHAMGFHPSARRDYDHAKPVRRVAIGVDGKPQVYVTTGTITATGLRRSYQAVKRNRVLRTAVMRAE